MPRQSPKTSLLGYLAIYEKFVAEKMNMGQISSWSNSNYIKLSAALAKETQVYISKNTLKRIFGKLKTAEFYYPQQTTLNALAVFIGFKDWDDFEQSEKVNLLQESHDNVNNHKAVVKPKLLLHKSYKKIALIFGINFLVISLVIGFVFWKKSDRNSYQKVRLTCSNSGGKNFLPVVFVLHFPAGFKDASLFTIQFGDNEQLRVGVNDNDLNIHNPNTVTIVHQYQLAGQYKAVLNYKDKPIDTASVYLESGGWSGYLIEHSGLIKDHKKIKIKNFNDQCLSELKMSQVHLAGIDTSQAFFTNFLNMKKTTISGDNFELLANVKPIASWCSQVNFKIYGSISEHYSGVISPECVIWADADFSEQIKTGTWTNLSQLGVNLKAGGDLRLLIQDKHVKFYANNKLIYTTVYKKSIGKIVGVKFLFTGIGKLRSFSLRDLKTNEHF
ncbi:hypothetical protein [Pedobacter nototheniae]|uniref:hypothetical protein n=1 Tax=Pedobacter nototheniae TaxID=2488994 RepID=UPI0029306624|nr:hypothetical protein [Pedobacter nototheniae]